MSALKPGEFLKVSCLVGSNDFDLFCNVWNEGIDSHLEAFCLSKYHIKAMGGVRGRRLFLEFHWDELGMLDRRLREQGTEDAESWADDIQAAIKGEFPFDEEDK